MRNPIPWLEAHRHHCFDFLRMYLGVGLFVKGVLFASDPAALHRLMVDGRLDAWGAIIAHYVVTVHLCGGVMLMIGLLTRVAALAQVPILLGAVLFVHRQDGLFTRAQNLEFTLFLLLALVLLAVHGSGRLSVDWYLFAQPKQRAEIAGEQRA